MGDVLGGLFDNFGVGGGKGNAKTKSLYLGENAYQKPLEDLMGLMAQEANQQRAQRNLLFGGGGYGGSFMTAAQNAQRSAGQPVDNSKPWGGWGGYGSGSPTQWWDPTNTRPDWTNGVPNYGAPSGGGGAPPGGGGAPPGGGPPPAVPPIVFGDGEDFTPPTRGPSSGGGGGGTGGVWLPIPGSGGEVEPVVPVEQRQTIPGVTGGTSNARQGYAPFDRRAGDAFYQSELAKQEAGQRPGNDYLSKAQSAMLADPKVKAFYEGMKGLGYGQFAPNISDVHTTFATTDIQPEDLLKHYGELLKKRGGDPSRVGSAGHGAEFMLPGVVDRIKQGYYGKPAWSTDEDTKNPTPKTERVSSQWKDYQYDPLGKAGLPQSVPQGYDAQQAKWDRTFGKAKNQAAAQKQAVTSVRQSLTGNLEGQNASATGEVQAPVQGSTAKGGTKVNTGEGDEQNYETGGAWTDPSGKVWTKGEDGNFYDSDKNKLTDEVLANLIKDYPEWDGWTDLSGENWRDLLSYGFGEGPEDRIPQRPSQFGQQGFNPTVNPATGQPYDASVATGAPGYAAGDAWSTSPGWRPEAPTGGLYGAYSDLASGLLTPYENRIMEGWQGRAVNPANWMDENVYGVFNQFASGEMTPFERRALEGWQGRSINPMGWADGQTLDAIENYSKTPARGEDEAYGAYNTMLKEGYSPAEQNAITQEGMRAARAGYETQRDAVLRNQARTGNSAGYAANVAKMARGFSDTMGSQARQNQIQFADEAQRRKETGAGGMLNLAGIGNQRSQYSINARQGFGNELARRQETALSGMDQGTAAQRGYRMGGAQGIAGQSQEMARRQETALGGQTGMAGYGRDLQKQGLAGQHALYQAQDPTAIWSQAAQIARTPKESYTETGNFSGGI